ncbi:hypothetical protein [Silvimonas sp.]|uniref:hypothetical protein n=1 Tax=Silvimonas sp. TaxID=2650811 RepID=UPI002840A23D|nr:hypothetical protein [Silvimonas sp.]MDR3428270.1 hypothetical protein [Silvimonas sp.]
MNKFYSWGAALGACIALAACNGTSSSSSPSAPSGFSVTAADGAAIVTWNQQSGLSYWLFGAMTSNLTVSNVLDQPHNMILSGVSSPYVVASLTNGSAYSFLMNATKDSGPAGSATAAVTVVPQASGYTWLNGNAFSAGNQYGQAWGTNLYAAVGAGGAINTSPDGINWTARSSGTANDLYAATYTTALADVFVAVGANGAIVTSPDAATWTVQASGTAANLRAISFNGTYYVAVGDNGAVLTSTNAYTWTIQPAPTTANLYGITYDSTNSTFYAVGSGGVILSSTDGWQWTLVTSNTTNDLYSIAFGNALFVAVGANGTIMQSADGVTWAQQSSPTNQNLYSVVYGSQFAAAGAGGVTLNGTPAGTAWTASSSGTSQDLHSLSFDFYRLLALGNAGTNVISY